MTTSHLARIGALSLIVSLSVAPVALATQNDNSGQGVGRVTVATPERKVTICHRTNAINNPYTRNSVAIASVDGSSAAHENGNNEDHLEKHIGPVFDAAVHTRNSDDWGDIIPPFDEDGNSYASPQASLNWPDGQAIWNNKCNIPTATPTSTPSSTPLVIGRGDSRPTPTPVVITGSVLGAQTSASELPKTGSELGSVLVALTLAIGAGFYSHLRGFSKIK